MPTDMPTGLAPDVALAWRELARLALAVQLGETDAGDALAAMCRAIEKGFGLVLQVTDDGAAPASPDKVRLRVGHRLAIVTWDGTGLDPTTNTRLGQWLALLDENETAGPSVDLHRLRNQAAGIQANIELAKWLLEKKGKEEAKDDLLRALQHAGAKCRELAIAISPPKR